MTQVLNFSRYSGLSRTPAQEGRATRHEQDESDDFWPEVSRQASPNDGVVDPANAAQRVLFEVFLVLAAAAGAVAAVMFFVPGP